MSTKEKSRPTSPSAAALSQNFAVCNADCNTDCNAPCIADCSTSLVSLQEEVTHRFQPKKEKSQKLGEVYRKIKLYKKAHRVNECGNFLEFAITDKARLHDANFCKDRLCPMCNWRRSMKLYSQVSKIMNVIEGRGYVFLFLTLTVRNCKAKDLPKTIDLIYDGWRYLYHKHKVFKKSILGTFRSLEITYNEDADTWHPHLHCVLVVKESYFQQDYITKDEWIQLWRKACKLDYDPSIDIRRIKPNEKGIVGAVCEVIKYAVKDADYLTGTERQVIYKVRTLLESLTNRRLCGFTGLFAQVRKELKFDDAENGDLTHVETEPLRSDIAELIVRYYWKNGIYIQEVVKNETTET